MDCVSFLAWVGSGAAVVLVLQFLKMLPTVGPIFEKYAMWVAPLLSVFAPLIAQALAPLCAAIDPVLWTGIFSLVTYALSQLWYWLIKQVPPVASAIRL